CWIQLLVEQHAAENRCRRQFTHRANDRSRAKMISTGSRACAFCQRGVGFTPVRCCHSLRAKRYVSGDRRRTRVIVAANRTTTVAWVMVLFQFVDIGLISASQQRIDGIIVVAVL